MGNIHVLIQLRKRVFIEAAGGIGVNRYGPANQLSIQQFDLFWIVLNILLFPHHQDLRRNFFIESPPGSSDNSRRRKVRSNSSFLSPNTGIGRGTMSNTIADHLIYRPGSSRRNF